jgi:hypothetical protein
LVKLRTADWAVARAARALRRRVLENMLTVDVDYVVGCSGGSVGSGCGIKRK